jgi:hypothetical protein
VSVAFPCDCTGDHVQVTIGDADPEVGVHLVDWVGGSFHGGACPRGASEEDGLCDICRAFLAGTVAR